MRVKKPAGSFASSSVRRGRLFWYSISVQTASQASSNSARVIVLGAILSSEGCFKQCLQFSSLPQILQACRRVFRRAQQYFSRHGLNTLLRDGHRRITSTTILAFFCSLVVEHQVQGLHPEHTEVGLVLVGQGLFQRREKRELWTEQTAS